MPIYRQTSRTREPHGDRRHTASDKIVYHHHGSKEGLYLACVRRAREELEQRNEAALEGVTDPKEQIRIAGDVFFSILEADPDRWTVLFGGSSVPLFGDLGAKLTELRLATIARIAERIRVAAPDIDEEGAEAAAHFISGVGEQLGRWWLLNPRIPRTRVVEYYTESIWGGLSGTATYFGWSMQAAAPDGG